MHSLVSVAICIDTRVGVGGLVLYIRIARVGNQNCETEHNKHYETFAVLE